MIRIIIECDRFIDAMIFARALGNVDGERAYETEETVYEEETNDRQRRRDKKL